MRFIRTSKETFEGIEIRGKPEFLFCTQESLCRLQSTSQFELIRNRVRVIRQGQRSGMKVWAVRPTFTVGKASWRHSVVWYAGAIAHDAYHAKLYCDAKGGNRGKEPDADAWTGAEAEKLCLAFQRRVLVELNADEEIISYLDRCAQNPTYQGHTTGWRSWLDYLLRWW
jgi:hypothetical protein